MALMSGYVELRRCGVQTAVGEMGAVPCSLLVGHTGEHYWAMQFPDLHIAVGWHSIGPAPDKRTHEEEGVQRLLSDVVGTHQQGAGL